MIVEMFNNGANPMATMNFSIPDDTKDRFNDVFEGQNKSAVAARALEREIEDELRRRQSGDFVERLRAIRNRSPIVSEDAIRAAREELRK